jgi:hypothetical protein
VWAKLRSHTTPTEDDVSLVLHHEPEVDGNAVVSRLWAGPVPVDPHDAVRTAEVLDAARRSAREGRFLDV